jgi:selenocysteine lyase/cysteine desulfurase
LDHAATTWPKNPRAVQAAFDFIRDCGATAGRGTYQSSAIAERWLTAARDNLAKLIGAASGHSIAMCTSGTHALNAALMGLLRPGDHLLTTDMEHNSVLRPIAALERTLGIQVSHAPSDSSAIADVKQAAAWLRPNTKLIVVGHASNVTGAVQSLEPWSALARQSGATLVVDASQTLGYLPIDVQAMGIDVLAAAGHKGLRALPGSGLLYVKPELQSQILPLMFGGTGRASEQLDGGQGWPSAIEVGNLNLPGAISMAVAAEDLLADASQWSMWQTAFDRLIEGLSTINGLHLVGYPGLLSAARVPLVSLLAEQWDVHDLAAVLDTSFGIETRAGWHCAALVHAALGSTDTGGTLRLSTGHTTTLEEVEITISAFHTIFQES